MSCLKLGQIRIPVCRQILVKLAKILEYVEFNTSLVEFADYINYTFEVDAELLQ